MKRTLLLLLATSFATACAPGYDEDTPESAADEIVNGEVDTTHEAVVAIRFNVRSTNGERRSLCTGTLIGPRTILTAAHCVVPQRGQTISGHEVHFGSRPAAGESGWWRVVRTAAHPEFSNARIGDKLLPSYDVALLTLAKDAPEKPIKVATRIDGDLTGLRVTHVGYGTTLSLGPTEKHGAGEDRYHLSLPVTEHLPYLLRTGNGVSGICNGDSGGPALLRVDGEDVVVGVHSFVDDDFLCLQNGYSVRTDMAADFVFAEVPASLYGKHVVGRRGR